MKAMQFITKNILQIGVLALVIVFQPELRRALEQVGRSRIGKLQVFSGGMSEQETRAKWVKFINALVEEASSLLAPEDCALRRHRAEDQARRHYQDGHGRRRRPHARTDRKHLFPQLAAA